MLLRCLFLLLVFDVSLSSPRLLAQQPVPTGPAAATALAFYDQYIGANSHLFNGSEYIMYDLRIRGNAFFMSSTLQKGLLNYDGILFDQVDLGYDIVRDEVTTNRYHENFRLRLVSEKISSFSLFNHFFVRLAKDSAGNSPVTAGFYDRLYDGRLKLYAKRQKKIEEKVNDEGDNLWFEEKDSYVVWKDGRYYPVKDRAQLFELVKDRKKDVKRFLKKNKMKFRKQPEETILKAIGYYDQIKI